jgi:Tfp pilus assembly protein PilP
MKLRTGIMLLAMTAGSAAWGQNPDVIQNTRDTMKAVGQKAEMDRSAALAASQSQAKPAAGTAAATSPAPKPSAAPSAPAVAAPKPKSAAKPAARPKAQALAAKAEQAPAPRPAAESSAPAALPGPDAKTADKSSASKANRRDPFVSPVVQRISGSGCSTGKRCLAIDQIALKGIIRSESGMIAVVTNALDKAYFLRENDPVFNGYVVKITGDSVVFRESFQDRLGKSATRDVVKKIVTPAV